MIKLWISFRFLSQDILSEKQQKQTFNIEKMREIYINIWFQCVNFYFQFLPSSYLACNLLKSVCHKNTICVPSPSLSMHALQIWYPEKLWSCWCWTLSLLLTHDLIFIYEKSSFLCAVKMFYIFLHAWHGCESKKSLSSLQMHLNWNLWIVSVI